MISAIRDNKNGKKMPAISEVKSVLGMVSDLTISVLSPLRSWSLQSLKKAKVTKDQSGEGLKRMYFEGSV